MKFVAKPTNRFRKDYKMMEKRNVDMCQLPQSKRDHELTGNFIGHRECHIQPNWFLIYRLDNDVLVSTLTRTDTHSDLL